jgi:hypothetical protein
MESEMVKALLVDKKVLLNPRIMATDSDIESFMIL